MDKNKIKKGLVMTKVLFTKGFAHYATDGNIVTASALIGLQQGLKYNGNVKRGLATGGIVYGGLCVLSGLCSVAANTNIIREFANTELESEKDQTANVLNFTDYKVE